MDNLRVMISRVIDSDTDDLMQLLALADLDAKEDLAGLDVSRQNLQQADLSGADLSGANLSGANLSGANLSGADLSRAFLSGANLSGAYLLQAQIDTARGDINTQLPEGLIQPTHWPYDPDGETKNRKATA